MQITIKQLRQLIREAVDETIEEECDMDRAREGGPLRQEDHDEMGYNDHEMGYDLHDRHDHHGHHGHHGHDREMEDRYLDEYLAEAKKAKEEDKKDKKPAKKLPAFIVKAQEIAAAKKKAAAAAAKKKAAARK